MEYIKKCMCPSELSGYKVKYTQGWLDHYKHKTKEKIPNDNYWTKNIIREPLIKSFKNNCGYCGREIARYQDRKPAGQVDHFKPKSKSPQLVYKWNNYIWSCADCNKKKSEEIGFLNPCNKKQMRWLGFDGSTGKYLLKPKYKKNSNIKHRFEKTQKLTLFNTGIVTKEKKVLFNDIENSIKDLHELPEKIKSQEDEEFRNYLLEQFRKATQTLKANLGRNEKSHFFIRKRIIRYTCKKKGISIIELYFSIKRFIKFYNKSLVL